MGMPLDKASLELLGAGQGDLGPPSCHLPASVSLHRSGRPVCGLSRSRGNGVGGSVREQATHRAHPTQTSLAVSGRY